jgi:hypothetical protein
MSKDPYADFTTDDDAVSKGLMVDYGSFRVRVALVDESNKPFSKMKALLFKPLQHKIETKTVRDEEVMEVLQEAFASKGILSWEVKNSEGNFVPGICLPDGTVAEASKANIMTVFAARERVFKDLYKQAGDYTLFRKAELDEERKN